MRIELLVPYCIYKEREASLKISEIRLTTLTSPELVLINIQIEPPRTKITVLYRSLGAPKSKTCGQDEYSSTLNKSRGAWIPGRALVTRAH